MATPGARRWFRPTQAFGWRLGFIAVGLLAIVLGYRGLAQALAEPGSQYSHQRLDLIYYTLQLFVLGSPPLDNGGHFPAMLQIARFAAPAVSVYAILEAARALFASELGRLRTRHARGHDIVCGSSAIAEALVARLLEHGRRVVHIPAGGAATPQRGAASVPGNPTTVEVLRNAGTGRARTLYVCTDDSAQNLAVADLATGFRAAHPSGLDIHVHVDDPEFCLALQARRLGVLPSTGTGVNFFSTHDLAARKLLETQPPPRPPGRAPQLMIVGASRFGAALIVELARYWRLQDALLQRPLSITLVDDEPCTMIERIQRLYPFLTDSCVFTARQRQVQTLLDGDLPDEPPDRVYVCCDDEGLSLKLALTMDHFWRRGPRSLVVAGGRVGTLDRVFDAGGRDPLLEGSAETLCLFDSLQAGCDPRLVEDSLIEHLARAIHEQYLTEALQSGSGWGSRPAMRPWHSLDGDLRAANRAQAVHIGTKLRGIGCTIAPNPIWGEAERLDRKTVEHLAELEHERWCAAMDEQGWTHGSTYDKTRRIHPDLVGWDDLPEQSRDKDRRAVRALPAILGNVGFQIVRIRPPGTRDMHEDRGTRHRLTAARPGTSALPRTTTTHKAQ